jgi:hypothetical protein
MHEAILGQKACRAVGLWCGHAVKVAHQGNRLGAFSGLMSRQGVGSCKTLLMSIGFSGASPHQYGVQPHNILWSSVRLILKIVFFGLVRVLLVV